MTLKQFMKQAKHLSLPDKALIKSAFIFSQKAHSGQKRFSGEPFFSHPGAVALELTKMGFDGKIVSAGLLHDTLEDTSVSREELAKNFGGEILEIVEGVTKLGKVRLKKTWFGLGLPKKERLPEYERQIETLKKMFLAMSRDIRVVIIKIIDRLHNMQTIQFLAPEKRLRFASETLKIYAPLAYRLGMGEIKGKLEDLAFPIVYPEEYQILVQKIKSQQKRQQKVINKAIRVSRRLLALNQLEIINIHGRVKYLYSLYKKMNLAEYDGDIAKIFDLVAVRIIVKNVADCYCALGIIHQRWRPLPGRVKDFIALPKPNGYSSLHTTVFGPAGKPLEIQIRTPFMHEQAEYGIAAHWQYKEKTSRTKNWLKKIFPDSSQGIKWLTNLIRIQKNIKDPYELAKILELDFFSDRIFVFTPAGDVKDLPQDASPIDFAYAIHTEVGHHYAGARVNGQMVNYEYRLKNNDIVEIIVKKKARARRDWLKAVKTSDARQKIRRATQKA